MKLRSTALIIGFCVVSACAQTGRTDVTEPPREPAKFELGSTELTYLLFGLAVLITAVR